MVGRSGGCCGGKGGRVGEGGAIGGGRRGGRGAGAESETGAIVAALRRGGRGAGAFKWRVWGLITPLLWWVGFRGKLQGGVCMRTGFNAGNRIRLSERAYACVRMCVST